MTTICACGAMRLNKSYIAELQWGAPNQGGIPPYFVCIVNNNNPKLTLLNGKIYAVRRAAV